MTDTHFKSIALIAISLLLFFACSTSDSTVVVVEESPETEEARQADSLQKPFTEITVGLIDPVTNYDPLFAENLSTQRVLALMYEGLFALDRNGEPVPDLVESFEISEDSLEYLFTLKENRFFHSSPVFSAGVGRRLQAVDVKAAFERTAKMGFPDHAASLLMSVAGYENYYLEQRNVYDPQNRVLDDVAGIQAGNNRLQIVLEKKDPNFLKKLSSPYLFIYPRELIDNRSVSLKNQPVGTGPYSLGQSQNANEIVLNRYTSTLGNRPQHEELTDRINLVYLENESDLFERFAEEEIDWIPEIGPDISGQVLNENDELTESYSDIYKLTHTGSSRITAIYLNENSEQGIDWLTNRLAYLTEEDFSMRGDLTLQVDRFEINEDAEPDSSYYISNTSDFVAKSVLNSLHRIVFQPQSSLAILDIQVPTRQTSLYTRLSDSVQQSFNPIPVDYWLRVDTGIISLYHDHVTGIESTVAPWLLHLEDVAVRNRDAESGTP